MATAYLIGYIDKAVEKHVVNRYSDLLPRGRGNPSDDTDPGDILFSDVDQALSRRDNQLDGINGLDLPFVSYYREVPNLSDSHFNFPASSIGSTANIPNLGNVTVSSSNFELPYEINYWDTKLLQSADIFSIRWEESKKSDHVFPVQYPFEDPNSDSVEFCEFEYQYNAGDLQDNSVTAKAAEREGVRIRYTGELLVNATVYKVEGSQDIINQISIDAHQGTDYIEETKLADIDVS